MTTYKKRCKKPHIETEILKSAPAYSPNSLPSENGLCTACGSREACPMPSMLNTWSDTVQRHGSHSVAERMELDKYEECCVDKPEINSNGDVIWCPMAWEDK